MCRLPAAVRSRLQVGRWRRAAAAGNRFSLRAVLLVAGAALLLAAPQGARKEALHIPIWIQGGEGETEPALALPDLNVSLGGAAVRASGLLGPGDDLVLLVVSDVTGDITLSDLAKRALNERIDRLPPNALVGLLRAQDGLRVLVDPTADRTPVKSAVSALPVSGKAALLECIRTAVALGDAILAKAAVRVAVLFLTDSDVSNYREDFTNPTVNWTDSRDISRRFRDGLVRERISRLDAALAATETPVFILHLVYRTDTLNQAYQTGLMTLSSTTGGASYFCRSQSEISDAMASAFAAITSRYSLTVPLRGNPGKTVDVVVDSPGRSLGWRTRFSLGGQ